MTQGDSGEKTFLFAGERCVVRPVGQPVTQWVFRPCAAASRSGRGNGARSAAAGAGHIAGELGRGYRPVKRRDTRTTLQRQGAILVGREWALAGLSLDWNDARTS